MSIENSTIPVPMDIRLINQAGVLHFGIVMSCRDPQKRGRVLVECPSVYGEGAENWTTWAEYCGNPIGTKAAEGDMGIWWPSKPGMCVLLGFEGGNPERPYCLPGPAWGNKDKPSQIPYEASSSGNNVDKLFVLKSEAGATLCFDDRGKQETTMLVDWTGQGHFFIAPGKTEDAASSAPCAASQLRKGQVRGKKTVFSQNSGTPGALVEGGVAAIGHLDLNGQGVITLAKDGEGKTVIMANKQLGEPGPNIILDAKDDCIYLTAGETQLKIDGKAGAIYVTKQMIWEMPFVPMVEWITQVLNFIKESFRKYNEKPPNSDGGEDKDGVIV